MKNIALMEFENNPNIGLFIFVNDKFGLIGKNVEDKKVKEIEDIFKVPFYKVSILNTELIGVFVSGNNEFLLIPEIFDNEKETLLEITKKHDIKLIELKNNLNTFGNNIVFMKDLILISKEYDKNFIENLENLTNKKALRFKSKNFDVPGSLIKNVDEKLFISQEFDDNNFLNELEENKIDAEFGSVNSGAIFVSSGILGNKNGLILGSKCSTIEIDIISNFFD